MTGRSGLISFVEDFPEYGIEIPNLAEIEAEAPILMISKEDGVYDYKTHHRYFRHNGGTWTHLHEDIRHVPLELSQTLTLSVKSGDPIKILESKGEIALC